MDLKGIATQLFTSQISKLGGNVDASTATNALSQLIGEGKDMDLGGLVSQLGSGSLAGAAKSWLGDGANEAISPDQITQALGADKVAGFAKQLGVDSKDAASSLAEMIPNLVNQSSKGGSLLEGLGGIGGLASKFLK